MYVNDIYIYKASNTGHNEVISFDLLLLMDR
jgi:hypothetical protein